MSVVFLLMIAATLLPCCRMESPPRVLTRDGVVVGTYIVSRDGRKVAAFMGIPYAKPPVGDLRFEPPQPPDPWEGELDASTRPPSCLQVFITSSQSEDCLYLNVYKPDDYVGPALPVMFWIYGGEFVFGAGDFFSPTYFMDEDVVYVSFNYRLGLFGFLSTNDEVVPGNMALKDIRQALRWVKYNIQYFGGNPSRVTIFGESAGSASVHYVMSFMANEGLFHAAICQSGVSLAPWAFRQPEQVKDDLQSLIEGSGCPEDSPGLVECLRQKTAVEILGLSSVPDKQGGFDIMPKHSPSLGPTCVEDRVVTDNPWRVWTKIPWIVGVNRLESLYFLVGAINDKTGVQFQQTDLSFDQNLLMDGNYEYSSANGSLIPAAVRQFYLNDEPISRATLDPTGQILSDVYFIYPTYEAASRGRRTKTFFYQYEYIGVNPSPLLPVLPEDRIGTCHGEELVMFFPIPGILQTDTDIQVSKTLVKLWTNFATYLDPTPDCQEGLDWQPFSRAQSYLAIAQEGLEMRNYFLEDRMTFWREHPFPYRDDNFRAPNC